MLCNLIAKVFQHFSHWPTSIAEVVKLNRILFVFSIFFLTCVLQSLLFAHNQILKGAYMSLAKVAVRIVTWQQSPKKCKNEMMMSQEEHKLGKKKMLWTVRNRQREGEEVFLWLLTEPDSPHQHLLNWMLSPRLGQRSLLFICDHKLNFHNH